MTHQFLSANNTNKALDQSERSISNIDRQAADKLKIFYSADKRSTVHIAIDNIMGLKMYGV